MTEARIVDFLAKFNRPISLEGIIRNFDGDITKAEIENALNSLVNQSKIIVKTYKDEDPIYCIKQTITSSNVVDCIRDVTTKIIEVRDKLNNEELKTRPKSITLQQLLDEKNELLTDIQQYEEQVAILNSANSVDYSMQIREEYLNYAEEYKRRKRICMQLFEMVLEDYPLSRQQLLDDIVLETDEDEEFELM